MTDPAPIVLHLEITDTGEPITGRIGPAAGVDMAFTGWLELAAAIEQAIGLGNSRPA